MGISNVIQIPDNLQQLQRFLEQCLSSDSPNAEFIESLVTLAQFKGESLEVVKQKLVEAGDMFSIVTKLQRQIAKHAIQMGRLSQNRYSTDHSSSVESSVSLDSYVGAFETELTDLLIQSYLEIASERNFALSTYLDLYWDYTPQQVQDFLVNLFQLEVKCRDEILSENKLHIDYMPRSYEVSFSALTKAASRILNSDSLTPKLRFPESFYQKSAPTTSDNNVQKDTLKSYTLEELLENVTPENYHEPTDWGKVVGNEIW